MRSFLFLLLLSSSTLSFGQDLAGKFVIEPMIGIPNAGRAYIAAVNVFDEFNENYKVTGLGVQIGGRLEYIATDNIGIGFETNYESSGYERLVEGANYNPQTNQYEDTIISWGVSKLRFMGRFMFHFGNFDKVDLYTGAGIGYTRETQTNSENGYNDPIDYGFLFVPKLIDRVFNPICARIYFGSRFLFTDNIGLTTEVGLGAGSILQVGLVARF